MSAPAARPERKLTTDRRVSAAISVAEPIRGSTLIPVKKILLLQAEQKYVTAYLADSEAVLSDTLKEIEEEFADLFVRVHRNALVARDAIEGLSLLMVTFR